MFCSNCGHDAKDANFCPSCGTKITSAGQQAPAPAVSPAPKQEAFVETVLWEGVPSDLMGKAKSAAKVGGVSYRITNQRISISKGIIGKTQEDIELRDVKDYKVTQSMTDKLQGVGDLTIISVDPSAPNVTLNKIEKPTEVKEILRKAVMEYKQYMNIQYRESV